MLHGFELPLLICAGLIALGILTSLISYRFGAPLLLVFLLLGLSAGEDGIGGIAFDNAGVAYTICSIAIAVVLFDSGCGTPLSIFRVAGRAAISMATVGVLVTAVLLAAFAHYALGFAWIQALLLGALMGATDAAAVFFLLRVGGVSIRDRVRATLEIESGSNDPMAVFLTVALLSYATGRTGHGEAWGLSLEFARQMGVGLGIGVLGGWLLVTVLRRLPLERTLLPLFALSLALCLYALTQLVDASGFLAVYVAGLVVGNGRLEGIATLRRFQSAFTWLAQIVMFITLGLLATPTEFVAVAWKAVVLAAVLMFVARPLAAWISVAPFGFNARETLFVGWVGLRGAVSILLGILPMLMGLEGGRELFNLAFLMVLISLLVQGWTIAPVARFLKQVLPLRRGPVERVALDLPGLSEFEFVCYRIAADSAIARGARLPRWSRPSLVLRGHQALRIQQAGPLRAGDLIYLIVPEHRVPLLDRVFAAPRAPDKSDRVFFGDFALGADVSLADLVASYGISPGSRDVRSSLGAVLEQEFDGAQTVGDRLSLGPIDIIVRELDEQDRVVEVGLALNPPRSVPSSRQS